MEFEVVDKLKVDGTAIFQSSTSWRSAPPKAPAGTGLIYFNPFLNRFAVSENGGSHMQFQQSIEGECGAGSRIRAVNEDGTVLCDPGAGLPAGVIVLSTGTCPAGFQELPSFMGRFPMGTPYGGAAGALVGTPLGNLGTITHTHPFTPSGTVSAPVFTGNSGTSGSESAHTHSFTPAGTVSASFTGTPGTSDSGGSHTHGTGGPSVTVSLYGTSAPTAATGSHTHSAVAATHTHGFTPTGTISASFTGNSGTSGAGAAHAHSFTPAGSFSSPVFTGTPGTTGSGDATPPYIQARFCLKT